MKILGFCLISIIFLSSFDNVYTKNDSEIEDEVIKIINIERVKIGLPSLTRNKGMDLACKHHAIYLDKLRDMLGKSDFVSNSKEEINGTPKSHFEMFDVPNFDELIDPTRRVSKYTNSADSLSCECASFFESGSTKTEIDIINGFKKSPRHWNVLMMKDLLKYWGSPKDNINEIGICVNRIKHGDEYRTICVINTK